MKTTITSVLAWEVLDSRGNPTVACEVGLTGDARGTASVPSGASTGTFEALELRDGGTRYGGKGVRNAVRNVNGPLAAEVYGMDATDQEQVDAALRSADGTAGLQRLGANAVLAVSLATATAAAAATDRPLYRQVFAQDESPLLPMPMVNIISGGAHAGRALDIQDLLVVPVGADSFTEAIEMAWRVRRGTAAVLDQMGLPTALIADEGGLGPRLPSNRAALDVLMGGIETAGLQPEADIAIAIDVAATQFYDAGSKTYRLEVDQREIVAEELVAELATWCARYPIVSIEDALADQDWDNWPYAAAALSHIQLLGDDLFVTDGQRLARGIADGVANAVLVKPNQTGTLSAARDVIEQARSVGFATVLSARSGETEDAWLADLAVGWRTGQIKVGSTMRSERTAKWNRLLRIEAELGPDTRFAGASTLAPPSTRLHQSTDHRTLVPSTPTTGTGKELRPMSTESFIHRADDIDWYCELQGNGPGVVLVPSGEGDCTSFGPVAAALADRFTVLTFDMPGFSRTSSPPNPHDLTPIKIVDQVAALVGSLGLERSTFYGGSSGGIVVLGLIAGHPELVTNGIVHEVAPGDYRNGKSEPLLPGLCALSDDEIVEQCKLIFRELMNEDPAAWDALGDAYHARLERNFVTWVRHYVNYSGPLPAYGAADLTRRPIDWTIGGLTPAMTFFSNVQLAASLGLQLGLLPCKHFPQVSIPDLLADHISRCVARHTE